MPPRTAVADQAVVSHEEVAGVLRQMHAAGDNQRLNAYLAALADAGWPKVTLGQMLGMSRQAVSQRMASGVATGGDLPAAPPPPPRQRGGDSGRTRSGLRVPDVAALEAETVAAMRERLAAVPDSWDRMVTAAGLVDDPRLDPLRAERARLAWSLMCYEGVDGLIRAGCWARDEYHVARRDALGEAAALAGMGAAELTTLAEAKGIPRYRDARPRYYRVACEIVRRDTAARTAKTARDDLIRDFVSEDPDQQRYHRKRGASVVAEAVGLTPGRVWQIVETGRSYRPATRTT